MNCCPTNIPIVPLPLLLSKSPGPKQSYSAFPSLYPVLGSTGVNEATT